MKPHIKAGGTPGKSIKDTIEDAEIIFTMLPSTENVKLVITGQDGVLSFAKPNTVILDMSTIAPTGTDEVYALCKEKNIKFIEKQTPYSSKDLEIKIKNNFDRVTLVNFQSKERVTIDFNLKFSSGKLEKKLDNICIIEIKREKGNRKSEILSILKEKRIRPTSFSKYTIGSCILNTNLKYNNFKRKLLFINKISKNGIIWN